MQKRKENEQTGIKNDGKYNQDVNYVKYGNGFSKEFIDQMEDYEEFLVKYRQEMEEYFYDIVRRDSSQRANLKGWLNRARRAHLAK